MDVGLHGVRQPGLGGQALRFEGADFFRSEEQRLNSSHLGISRMPSSA